MSYVLQPVLSLWSLAVHFVGAEGLVKVLRRPSPKADTRYQLHTVVLPHYQSEPVLNDRTSGLDCYELHLTLSGQTYRIVVLSKKEGPRKLLPAALNPSPFDLGEVDTSIGSERL